VINSTDIDTDAVANADADTAKDTDTDTATATDTDTDTDIDTDIDTKQKTFLQANNANIFRRGYFFEIYSHAHSDWFTVIKSQNSVPSILSFKA